MPHQPMGAGGLDVEIGTGLPRRIKTQEERQAEEALKKQQAQLEAANLLADLQDNPGLSLIYRELMNRMIELATADPQCQGFKRIIIGWRNKLDPIPAVANHMARHSLGPVLCSFLPEVLVAPEGIPTE